MLSGTVLVVDDDPPLLRTMRVFLTRRSYEVVTCGSGAEALEKFQAAPGTYSVIVVDMTLRGMPAEQLIEQVLQIDRHLGVIVTSGYPVRLPLSANSSGRQIVALQKPFTPDAFVQTIEQMLASRR
jgi:DNA-binding NtrC family response regulator